MNEHIKTGEEIAYDIYNPTSLVKKGEPYQEESKKACKEKWVPVDWLKKEMQGLRFVPASQYGVGYETAIQDVFNLLELNIKIKHKEKVNGKIFR